MDLAGIHRIDRGAIAGLLTLAFSLVALMVALSGETWAELNIAGFAMLLALALAAVCFLFLAGLVLLDRQGRVLRAWAAVIEIEWRRRESSAARQPRKLFRLRWRWISHGR